MLKSHINDRFCLKWMTDNKHVITLNDNLKKRERRKENSREFSNQIYISLCRIKTKINKK